MTYKVTQGFRGALNGVSCRLITLPRAQFTVFDLIQSSTCSMYIFPCFLSSLVFPSHGSTWNMTVNVTSDLEGNSKTLFRVDQYNSLYYPFAVPFECSYSCQSSGNYSKYSTAMDQNGDDEYISVTFFGVQVMHERKSYQYESDINFITS